jgi:hypothetical protein
MELLFVFISSEVKHPATSNVDEISSTLKASHAMHCIETPTTVEVAGFFASLRMTFRDGF